MFAMFLVNFVVSPLDVDESLSEFQEIAAKYCNFLLFQKKHSQTVATEDAQPCQNAEDCHCLVPGMSQYSDSQTFSEVGTTEFKGSVSLSTSATHQVELFRSLDRAQESTNNIRNFSPATK